jgi:hypothetical protein
MYLPVSKGTFDVPEEHGPLLMRDFKFVELEEAPAEFSVPGSQFSENQGAAKSPPKLLCANSSLLTAVSPFAPATFPSPVFIFLETVQTPPPNKFSGASPQFSENHAAPQAPPPLLTANSSLLTAVAGEGAAAPIKKQRRKSPQKANAGKNKPGEFSVFGCQFSESQGSAKPPGKVSVLGPQFLDKGAALCKFSAPSSQLPKNNAVANPPPKMLTVGY